MLELTVEGSSGNRYLVNFARDGHKLRTSCTCPAGEKGIHCKHRLSLLAGDTAGVIGTLPDDFSKQITVLLAGSDLEQALMKLRTAEGVIATAQAELKQAKKMLDRVMHQ